MAGAMTLSSCSQKKRICPPWHRRVRAQLAAYVAAAQERGELDPALDADSTATQLVAVMDGLQVQWLLDREGVDMIAALRDFLDVLGQASSRSKTVSRE
jgi:BetI-type transcriptional repressor, C-terminal